MNWIVGCAFAWAVVMVGVCYTESVKDTAKYDCIAKVSNTLGADKAKELCK